MTNATIIPIDVQSSGRKIQIASDAVEELALKDLGITEMDLEEFVRRNIEVLFPDSEETLLIVGQQTRNQEGGRSDLVAVDGEGNVVLIELKRDKEDITARKEPFEFQAIRYAANYALIETPQDLVQKLFTSYVEKHQSSGGFREELAKGLTPSEVASKILDGFLHENQARGTFNRYQRIILIASSFDSQTLSASAWLARNGIDIRCIEVSPIKHGQQYFFRVEQIIPPPQLDQYFVGIAEPTEGVRKGARSARRTLPRMPALFEWELVGPGDKCTYVVFGLRAYPKSRSCGRIMA